MALPTYGTMAVDWENRVDFDRLRRERLARAKELLAKSEMGALLCFDMNNVRYLTATHIGTWAQDKANPKSRVFQALISSNGAAKISIDKAKDFAQTRYIRLFEKLKSVANGDDLSAESGTPTAATP